MADLDRVVSVVITRQTTVPTMESFDNILIVDEFLKASVTPVMTATNRVREYSSLSELVAAGFTDTTFVYKAAARIFGQNPSISKVVVGRKLTGADGTETWAQALTAILTEHADWYGLITSTRLKSDVLLIAAWVESNKKLYVTTASDSDILSGTGDVADLLKTAAYERTLIAYHSTAGQAPHEQPGDAIIDAAILGKMFGGYDPGSATWAYKSLAGISVDLLTPSQISTALGKNCNVYTAIAGVNVLQMGKVSSGEFADVIHGLDWLKARIQQLVFTPLANTAKVPYTNAGIEIIVSAVRTALQEGVTNSLLSSFTVSAPKVTEISVADRGTRVLPDVRFTAVLAGAVHTVEVDGVVTV